MKKSIPHVGLIFAFLVTPLYLHAGQENKTETAAISNSIEKTEPEKVEVKLSDEDKAKIISPYPEAKPNFKRHIIFLPALDDESKAKFELVIGKPLKVDCNQQRLLGKLEQKTVDGWGYNYFELDKVTGPVSTLMACPNNELTEKFVTIGNNSNIFSYNSKLPIVVYTPDDVLVKYRIWSVTSDLIDAK